jgi:hypothetical protein
MKIVNNKTKFIPFSDVKVGEIFSIDGTGPVYIKTESLIQYPSAIFRIKNAFCLSIFCTTEIFPETKCLVYDATLTLN